MARARKSSVVSAIALVIAISGAFGGACTFFDVSPPVATPAVHDDAATPEASAAFPGFLSLADAVRACSKIIGCTGPLSQSVQASLAISTDPTNFTHCVDALSGPMDPDRLNQVTSRRLACIAAAATCDAASRCVLYEFQQPPDPRCAGRPALDNFCTENGEALFCLSAADSLLVDCANEQIGFAARCTVDAGEPKALCLVDTKCPNETQCIGTVSDKCGVAGAHITVDCAASGLPCVPGKGCVAEPCLDQVQTACAGERMRICALANATLVDCAHVGAKCIKNNTTVACARDDDECSVYDEPRLERCSDPTTIKLCVGGRKTTFSCANVGMKCMSPAGTRSSYCAP